MPYKIRKLRKKNCFSVKNLKKKRHFQNVQQRRMLKNRFDYYVLYSIIRILNLMNVVKQAKVEPKKQNQKIKPLK